MTSAHHLVLQYRWKVVYVEGKPHLLYYGVRNPPLHREVLLPLSKSLARVLESKGMMENSDVQEIKDLVIRKVLVLPEEKRSAKTPQTMQTCTNCVVNDYVVPGLEFDDHGVCALCQCYEKAKPGGYSAFPKVTEEELRSMAGKTSGSRFDAMVLYTGGKDSSFMLWLLARKLGLRVLAAFWDMPYCTGAAYTNIDRARQTMPEVEFVRWALPWNTLRKGMLAKWRSHGWPCMCPSPAFALFYPMAARLRTPHVFLGIEDVQAAVLDHVVGPASNAAAPLTPREQTLRFLGIRALPRSQKQPLRWPDEMTNYQAAVRDAMPEVFHELADLVQLAGKDTSMHIPLVARLATNESYGTWKNSQEIIQREMGWMPPEGQNNLLHTSCRLEPVKDYLQFQRFKAMRTVFMPQSMVELGAAVAFGLTPRSEALIASQELGYWQTPQELAGLARDLGIDARAVEDSSDELRHSMAEWAGLSS